MASFSGSGSLSGPSSFSIISAGALLTGGSLFSDSTYYYTAFKTTGNNELIIANANLAVDMLSIGGGGNSTRSVAYGGGGGAGSVDFTSLTLTPGTYNALVGAAAQSTSLINNTTSTTLFTSNAGGEGQPNSPEASDKGASTGGCHGGPVSYPAIEYTGNNIPGSLGHAGGTGSGGVTTARNGGGGGGMGANGSNASSSAAGNGGIGIATYSDICSIVGIGELSGGLYYVGGGGGGGRGATQNTHGTHGLGIGANTGGGGDGGGPGRTSTAYLGYSGVIVLRYLKSAVA